MASLFSLSSPLTVFQVWFVVFAYLLPLLLYVAWTALAVLDAAESRRSGGFGWILIAILLPLVGGAGYLVFGARTLSRPLRYAALVAGTLVWLVPLVAALWIAGGPLGPKALN